MLGERGLLRDRLGFIIRVAEEVVMAHSGVRGEVNPGVQTERWIAWKRRDESWVTVNTDGASKGNPGKATTGGVIWNSDGEWLVGFALNIGFCSALLAELWGGSILGLW